MSPLITIEVWTALHSLFYNLDMCVHVQETLSSVDSGILLRHILVLIRLVFSKFEFAKYVFVGALAQEGASQGR